jgi:hypothetical protein
VNYPATRLKNAGLRIVKNIPEEYGKMPAGALLKQMYTYLHEMAVVCNGVHDGKLLEDATAKLEADLIVFTDNFALWRKKCKTTTTTASDSA